MKSNHILSIAISAGFFSSCCPGVFCPPCKIEAPLTGTDSSLDVSAKTAADVLNSSISKGEISGNVKTTVKKTYAAVPSETVALVLILKAADCESRRGNKEAASELRQLGREYFLAENNRPKSEIKKIAETPAALTPAENRLLQPSRLSADVQMLLPAE